MTKERIATSKRGPVLGKRDFDVGLQTDEKGEGGVGILSDELGEGCSVFLSLLSSIAAIGCSFLAIAVQDVPWWQSPRLHVPGSPGIC